MKNKLITGILFIFLGGLISFGPRSIFPVCGVHTAWRASLQSPGKMDEQESVRAGVQKTAQAAGDTGGKTSMTMTSSKVMQCHWTAQAEIGIGILIALLGVLQLVFKSRQVRSGLGLALILNGMLALLIPTLLIGVCGSVHMTCRSLALPALVILSGVTVVASAVNVSYLCLSK